MDLDSLRQPNLSRSDQINAVERIRLLLSAPAFTKLCAVATELSDHRKFNVFRFADKTISENSWSRVFAWLLDSTEDHELGVLPLQRWLQDGLGRQLHLKGPSGIGAVRTSTQFPTAASRYIDILIRIFDRRSRTIGVIGVENKVWSGEQLGQVSDYQDDLDKRFTCPKVIVFLTPDERKSITANDDLQTCPYIPQGYSAILDLCDSLRQIKKLNPNLRNLLQQMKSYLATEITTAQDAKDLVHRLYADKKYRAALRLISQYKPSTFDVFAEVKKRVENELDKRKIKCRWYPGRGEGKPYEVRLIPALTWRGSAPFDVNYILTCDDKDEPDIGDTFKLIVTAFCYNKAAVSKAEQFRFPHEPKPWREGTRRHWLTIWTGGEYRLKDLGSTDAKELSTLVLDAIDQTYGTLLRKAERGRIQ